ncbi:hypothetical protein EVJ50_01210 [Synechococcus sp. RSCCF101]|uniref:hypothetical protein n=1 Tax=Synechococcus sp. RSCCF101 TaxID=2511069 RepID=UPI0012489CD5|nr:hypothetical protein [Synechococcus sp. RSCCF101]QEY31076.1 hypothetical protein EVJ50_01210 [Synechococcus sp. RSCCF101]
MTAQLTRAAVLFGGLGLALGLMTGGGLPAAAAEDAGATEAFDVQEAGGIIGQDTGRRLCEGEAMQPAIERSMIRYLADRELTPSMMTAGVSEQMGEEVAVEALAYAFCNCPETAKALFKDLMRQGD